MKEIKSLCVYCGTALRCDEKYRIDAVKLGKIFARENVELVYGGGNIGLMGAIASSVLENNGRAIGFIPQYLMNYEKPNDKLTELFIVDSMHTRKKGMFDRSQGFVILPGGLGTLEELFEILTWKQLGMHDKPIIIVNAYGFWDPFLKLLDYMLEEKFINVEALSLYKVVDRVEDVIAAVHLMPEAEYDPLSKWF